MNKKILAILMALLMVLMSSVAMADFDGIEVANIYKTYRAVGDTAVAPATEFSFVIGAGRVQGASAGVTAPAPDKAFKLGTAKFTSAVQTSALEIAGLEVDWDVFTDVGYYSYPVTETQGTLAGVTYDATCTIYVIVTFNEENGNLDKAVLMKAANGEKGKRADIENTYTAGSLEISKTVTGAYGDPNKYFTITVTLTGEEGKTYDGIVMTAAGGKAENSKTLAFGANTFEIKHGETITLSNLPVGVSYTVTEADYTGEGYDAPVYAGNTGNIEGSEKDTCTITNNKDGNDIETGVNTDSMPYIMLMAFVMILAAAVVLKKRTAND